jgi:hypothetical protein
MNGWPESSPWQGEVRIPSHVLWAALRDKYPWLPNWERVESFDLNDHGRDYATVDIKCQLTDDEYAAIDAAGRAVLFHDTAAWWAAIREVAPWIPPADVTIRDSCTMTLTRDWDYPGQRLIGFRVWLADGIPRTFAWEMPDTPTRTVVDTQP